MTRFLKFFSATDLYLGEHSSQYLMVESDTYCITLETLVNEGYVDYPIKDMLTGNEIPLTNFVEADIDEYRNPVYTLTPTCSSNITNVIAGNFSNSCVIDDSCSIDDIRNGISIDVAVSGVYGGSSSSTYKFYVIDDDSEYLTLMLGDNLDLSYFSSTYNTVGPVNLFNALNTLTSTWENIEPVVSFNYSDSTSPDTYGYSSLAITSGTTVITSKAGGTTTIGGTTRARLIKASELVNIIKDSLWTSTNQTSYNSETPSWLTYGTSGIGTGYFTLSTKPSTQDQVWYMSNNGYLATIAATNNATATIKPVIKIKKTNIKNYIASKYVAGNASNNCVTTSTCTIEEIRNGISVDVAVSGTYGISEDNTYTFSVISDDGINVSLMYSGIFDLANDNDDLISFNTLNTDGPVNIFNNLNLSTLSWTNIPTIVSYDYIDSTSASTYGYNSINITDGVTKITKKDGTVVTINGNAKARIMSAEEIASVINNTTWVDTGTTLLEPGDMSFMTLTTNPTNSGLTWIYSTENGLTNLATSGQAYLIPVIVLPKSKIS